MNYSTHMQNIKNDFISALSLDKLNLIQGIYQTLEKAKKLSKTNRLQEWINFLDNTEWEDIAITRHAVQEVRKILINTTFSQDTFDGYIGQLCEILFTFWQIDDTCERGGQYLYYKYLDCNIVFKESGFGLVQHIQGEPQIMKYDCSIATISDLKDIIDFNDWY